MAFPDTLETFEPEENEILDGEGQPIGGTFTDAEKQNGMYGLLQRLETAHGLSGETASPAGSHEARIKSLEDSAGHIIEKANGDDMTQRRHLQFIGSVLTDSPVNDRTIVTNVPGHVILEETTPLTQRAKLAFQGPGVAVTDDAGNDQNIVAVSGAHAILDEEVPVTQRPDLSFQGTGVAVTDDSGNARTVVTVTAASTEGDFHPFILLSV